MAKTPDELKCLVSHHSLTVLYRLVTTFRSREEPIQTFLDCYLAICPFAIKDPSRIG